MQVEKLELSALGNEYHEQSFIFTEAPIRQADAGQMNARGGCAV